MGLDMYLHRRPRGVTETLGMEVLYLRKANQVRQWLVEHTGYDEGANCVPHVLTKEQLESLLADCKAVQENHELAPKLLPTSEGFFFGDTEYDNTYLNTIEATIEQLNRVLAETDFTVDEVIYWEWW